MLKDLMSSESLDEDGLARARDAVMFLMQDQEGYWPLTTVEEIARPPTWVERAEDVFPYLGRMDYMAPLPFLSKKKLKVEVKPWVDLCWCEIDPPTGMAREEQIRFAMSGLERMKNLGLVPCLVIFSGRGLWLYFKLDGCMPKERVEYLNKLLVRLSGSADLACVNADRYARLPGSTNEKTKFVARVLELTDVRLDPTEFTALVEEVAADQGIVLTQASRKRHATQGAARRVVGRERLDEPILRAEDWEYIRTCPTTDECLTRFERTRSDVEESIFCSMARQGWTEEEIHGFARSKGLSRYMEKEGVTDYGVRSISRALEYVKVNPWKGGLAEAGLARPEARNVSSYKGTVTYQGEEDDQAGDLEDSFRSLVLQRLRLYVLRMVSGQAATALYKEGADRFQVSRRTVMRDVKWLTEKGYLHVEKHGRQRLIVQTEQGAKLSASRFFPTRLLKGLMSIEAREEEIARIKSKHGQPSEKRRQSDPERPTVYSARVSLLSRLRVQARYSKRHFYDGRFRISFLPHPFWGRKATFHVQFLTEAAGPLFHEQRLVAWEHADERLDRPRFANFISPRDRDLDGLAGHDPLFDRFGIEPKKRGIAVAALLEETTRGFEIMEVPDLNGELVPSVGLVVQGINNFWDRLYKSVPDLLGHVIRVKRKGKDEAREFFFEAVAPALALDIPDRHMVDLDAYLDEIADKDRLDAMIDPLPDHWSFWVAC